MLCVSWIPRNLEEVERELDWVGRDADMVEVRLDRLRESAAGIDWGRIGAPVIATCRRPVDGGEYEGGEKERLDILERAVEGGAAYVDLELEVAERMDVSRFPKRIVSHHDLEKTPEDLDSLYRRAARVGGAVVKIAVRTRTPRDLITLRRLFDGKREIPLIAFGLGPLGAVSRILAQSWGSVLTYAPYAPDRPTGPGQVSRQELTEVYRHATLTEKTRLYTLLGKPLGHSMSPRLHNRLFRDLGIDARYFPMEGVEPASALPLMEELGIAGGNVTIPYKEKALFSVGRFAPESAGTGAVNTLWKTNGRWEGGNTDTQGFEAVLRRSEGERGIENRNVLILGSGGAARATAAVFRWKGGRLRISSRRFDGAQVLAREFGGEAVPWEKRGGTEWDLLVNATPVGMHPRPTETPYPPDRLHHGATVVDWVYNPPETELLWRAVVWNCRTVSGLDLFLEQALRSFARWTGRRVRPEAYRTWLREELERCHLATGF